MNITASLKLSWPRKLRTIKHFLSAIIPIVSLENANHHSSSISLAAMQFSQFKKPSLHSMLFNNFCDHERIMRRWSFRGVSLVGQWSCDELKRKNAWFFRVLPPSNSLETIKVNLVYRTACSLSFVSEEFSTLARALFLILMGIICSRGLEYKLFISSTPKNIAQSLQNMK